MEQAIKRRTQEERKAESERQIVNAAATMFARHGYLRTTLNEVGEEAGYTGGLVSHRFGSKAGLLKSVISQIGDRFITDQIGDAIEQDSAIESLKSYITIYLQEVGKREGSLTALYVIMGEALGSADDIRAEVAAFNERARIRMSGIIQRGINNGEFRSDIDAKSMAVLIKGMLRGVAMQYLLDPDAVDLDKVLPQMHRSAIVALT